MERRERVERVIETESLRLSEKYRNEKRGQNGIYGNLHGPTAIILQHGNLHVPRLYSYYFIAWKFTCTYTAIIL